MKKTIFLSLLLFSIIFVGCSNSNVKQEATTIFSDIISKMENQESEFRYYYTVQNDVDEYFFEDENNLSYNSIDSEGSMQVVIQNGEMTYFYDGSGEQPENSEEMKSMLMKSIESNVDADNATISYLFEEHGKDIMLDSETNEYVLNSDNDDGSTHQIKINADGSGYTIIDGDKTVTVTLQDVVVIIP